MAGSASNVVVDLEVVVGAELLTRWSWRTLICSRKAVMAAVKATADELLLAVGPVAMGWPRNWRCWDWLQWVASLDRAWSMVIPKEYCSLFCSEWCWTCHKSWMLWPKWPPRAAKAAVGSVAVPGVEVREAMTLASTRSA
jgi:hypothetical protein